MEYSCIDDEYEIIGNKTVTCFYSGLWSDPTACVLKTKTRNKTLRITTAILFPFIIAVFVVIAVLVYQRRILKRKRTLNEELTRTRKFDAFVCYNFDSDNDFVLETILELENCLKYNPPFRLFLHTRDFIPGAHIMLNIQQAIENSNSAIIILSQDFVSSPWCRAEFEYCYTENINYPAFRLFVIMMQPAGTIKDVVPSMKHFMSQQTYLEKNDPDLLQKIAEYLTRVKQHKADNTEEK